MYPVEGLEYQTNYQWRVRATYEDLYEDLYSDWSETWGFTTRDEPPSFYTLTVQKEGMGSVSSEDGAISCEDVCEFDFEEGSEVTLTAEPEDGWKFDSWSGDLTGNSNPAKLNMDGNKSVTAIFVEEQNGELSLQELEGFWKLIYRVLDNTCNDHTVESNVGADLKIMDEDDRQIKIEFENAPDHPLWGMVKLDGTFSGETDKVDVSGGEGFYFEQEFYNGQFARGEIAGKQKRPDHGIFFFGTSLFEVTDAEGEHYCKIEYDVEGEKMDE